MKDKGNLRSLQKYLSDLKEEHDDLSHQIRRLERDLEECNDHMQQTQEIIDRIQSS
jgi:septal ring factor EnvC (AmiA/AmiB activator)